MAKIREISLRVFGKHEKFQIHYAANLSVFEVRPPESLKDYARDTEQKLTAKSEDELIKKLKAFILKYEERKVNERKIIAYKFEWSSKNIPNNKERSRWHRSDEFTNEAKLEFEYDVYLEKSIDDKARYYKIKEKNENKAKDDFSSGETHGYNLQDFDIIDWTPEREAFMKGVYDSMEALISRIKAFTGTPDLMLGTIALGLKFLPMREEKVEKT